MQTSNDKPPRRWYQFSLRTLLIAMTIVACGCGWVAMKLNQGRRQRAVIEALKKSDVTIRYDFQEPVTSWNNVVAEPPGPKWLRDLVGIDVFANVTEVHSGVGAIDDEQAASIASGFPHLKLFRQLESKLTDSGLQKFSTLRQLQTLQLPDSKITDAGMPHLAGMTRMQFLDLRRTPITDAGLEHLQNMTDMWRLRLSHTAVHGSGLQYLRRMSKLKLLDLDGAKLDHGLKHLRGLNLKDIDVSDNPLDDDALAPLADLAQLESLNVSNTSITAAGLRRLETLQNLEVLIVANNDLADDGWEVLARLPKLHHLIAYHTRLADAGLAQLGQLTQLKELYLANTEISDAGLAHLGYLTELRTLDISHTHVTSAGVARLQALLPKCRIEHLQTGNFGK